MAAADESGGSHDFGAHEALGTVDAAGDGAVAAGHTRSCGAVAHNQRDSGRTRVKLCVTHRVKGCDVIQGSKSAALSLR